MSEVQGNLSAQRRGDGGRAGGTPELRALGCPRCGGALEIHEGAPLIRCEYCRSGFLAQAPGGTFRLIAPARIDVRAAVAVAHRVLSDPRVSSQLRGSATRSSCELFYVPFWRFRATFLGRVSGLKDIISRRPIRTHHGDDSGTGFVVIQMEEVRVGQEEVVEEIQEIWRATVSACPLHDLGVPHLSSRRQMAGGLAALAAGAGEIEGLSLAGSGELDGRLIDPMLSIEDARREAEILFERYAGGRGAELRDRSLRYERLQDRETLLYYPVYRVTFRSEGRAFGMSIDGLGGRIVHATLPGERHDPFVPLALAAGGGAWILGNIARAGLWPPPELPELRSPWAAMLLAVVILAGGAGLAAFLRELGRRLWGASEELVTVRHE